MFGAEVDEVKRPAGVLEGVLIDEPVFRFLRPSSSHMRKVLRIDALLRGFVMSLVMSGLAARPPSVIDLRGAGAAEKLLTCPGYVAMEESFAEAVLAIPEAWLFCSICSRSLASFDILPGGGLFVSRPPLPLELRPSSMLFSLSFLRSSRLLSFCLRSSRLFSFCRRSSRLFSFCLRSSRLLSFCLRSSRLFSFSLWLLMDEPLFENPVSSLFFLTRLAAPPRTVVAL